MDDDLIDAGASSTLFLCLDGEQDDSRQERSRKEHDHGNAQRYRAAAAALFGVLFESRVDESLDVGFGEGEVGRAVFDDARDGLAVRFTGTV